MNLIQLPERDLIAVTEHGAVAAAQTMGYGDEKRSAEKAIAAIHQTLEGLQIGGRVLIRAATGGKTGKLHVGEEVGVLKVQEGGVNLDLAVSPLEGATLCATGTAGAISVLVAAERGGLLAVPTVDDVPKINMEKIVVGPTAAGTVHLDAPVPENLRNIARAFGREVTDLTVVVLDRERHLQLVADIRSAGARVRLVHDGDLSAAISAAVRGTGVHAVIGTGSAAKAVITAAAMRCLGGEIQSRWVADNEREVEGLAAQGLSDLSRIYTTKDLAPGNKIIFSCTGVTDSELLRGVRFFGGGGRRTSSLFMSLATGLIRFVDTIYRADLHNPVHFH